MALEILKQLGYVSEKELEALAEFGPVKPVTNARRIVVGGNPIRQLLSNKHKPGRGDPAERSAGPAGSQIGMAEPVEAEASNAGSLESSFPGTG